MLQSKHTTCTSTSMKQSQLRLQLFSLTLKWWMTFADLIIVLFNAILIACAMWVSYGEALLFIRLEETSWAAFHKGIYFFESCALNNLFFEISISGHNPHHLWQWEVCKISCNGNISFTVEFSMIGFRCQNELSFSLNNSWFLDIRRVTSQQ